MNLYIKVNQYGSITEKVATTVDLVEIDNQYILVDGIPDGATHYFDGIFFSKPDAPSPYHQWDEVFFTWQLGEAELSAAKLIAKARITKARDVEESAGFTAFGKTIDSDAASIQRISLAVQAAQAIGESFSIEWTCQDNSTITLDYTMMQALPAFMAQAGNALHVKARTLKSQIDTAVSLEEIEAVQW
jgi:hypothetical protein